jgi:hypothetical protein
MAKKQKDKKINNGRHNNTQTNRQNNGQKTKRKKDLSFKRLPSGPIEHRRDITISSRIESIAGLVTCAKSCLK